MGVGPASYSFFARISEGRRRSKSVRWGAKSAGCVPASGVRAVRKRVVCDGGEAGSVAKARPRSDACAVDGERGDDSDKQATVAFRAASLTWSYASVVLLR